jgi:hypothetical protein
LHKSLSAYGLALLGVFGFSSDTKPQSASRLPGIKMTVRDTVGNIPSERTVYFQSDRKRIDFRSSSSGESRWNGSANVRYGPHVAFITRCDLGKISEVNLDTREYSSAPYPPKPLTKEQLEARGIKLSTAKELPPKPTLLIETTTVDTGERKQFFGHTARHVMVTRKQTPLEGSHQDPQESITDAWYIDIDVQLSCDRKWRPGAHAYLHAGPRPGEKPELAKFVDVGEPVTGFPVQLKTTSRGMYAMPDGTRKENTSIYETSVAQLKEGPLDASVFEIPAGFRQVAQIETDPPMDWQTVLANDWQWLKAKVRQIFN